MGKGPWPHPPTWNTLVCCHMLVKILQTYNSAQSKRGFAPSHLPSVSTDTAHPRTPPRAPSTPPDFCWQTVCSCLRPAFSFFQPTAGRTHGLHVATRTEDSEGHLVEYQGTRPLLSPVPGFLAMESPCPAHQPSRRGRAPVPAPVPAPHLHLRLRLRLHLHLSWHQRLHRHLHLYRHLRLHRTCACACTCTCTCACACTGTSTCGHQHLYRHLRLHHTCACACTSTSACACTCADSSQST